jgi:hypothetical protein
VDTIEGNAFSGMPLREIRISEGNDHFRVCGGFLMKTDCNGLIWYFGKGSDVMVLSEIRSLCAESLRWIWRLRFERDSELTRIESRAFSVCDSLRAICIPSSVEWIDGSAFAKSGICEVRVCEANVHFRVSGDFLVNYEGRSLIRYFGRDSIVRISNEIEIISTGSFDSCSELRELKFAGNSRLRLIEVRAFQGCGMLFRISVPASTEFLEGFSFAECRNVREVNFELGSKLRVIERDTFKGCSSLNRIRIPKSVEGLDGVDLSGVNGYEIEWFE